MNDFLEQDNRSIALLDIIAIKLPFLLDRICTHNGGGRYFNRYPRNNVLISIRVCSLVITISFSWYHNRRDKCYTPIASRASKASPSGRGEILANRKNGNWGVSSYPGP
ncbi:hypothetical protein BS17DRAFT_341907 [Gyrodon lividus]|nr:hypothetical protein BS17DRAFT_341907 [Gyrodon lividus]